MPDTTSLKNLPYLQRKKAVLLSARFTRSEVASIASGDGNLRGLSVHVHRRALYNAGKLAKNRKQAHRWRTLVGDFIGDNKAIAEDSDGAWSSAQKKIINRERPFRHYDRETVEAIPTSRRIRKIQSLHDKISEFNSVWEAEIGRHDTIISTAKSLGESVASIGKLVDSRRDCGRDLILRYLASHGNDSKKPDVVEMFEFHEANINNPDIGRHEFSYFEREKVRERPPPIDLSKFGIRPLTTRNPRTLSSIITPIVPPEVRMELDVPVKTGYVPINLPFVSLDIPIEVDVPPDPSGGDGMWDLL